MGDASGRLSRAGTVVGGDTVDDYFAASIAPYGDMNGDGNPDLIVGQAGPPLVAWLGGLGTFQPSDAIVPAVPLDVARLVLADADGDYDPDLAVAIKVAPMRLYIDRDGRLEDQSYVRLPTPIPTARAIAFGSWDASCGPEAVVAADAGTQTLRGIESAAFEGTFEAELAVAAATDALMIDIDDDGDLDAIIATMEGAQWLAR